ncbi:MAG: DUF5682 family protein [Bacteroidota bacterium]
MHPTSAHYPQSQLHKDPLGFMAKLAGYADSERWWDATFEQWENEAIFPAILEMMTALREESQKAIDPREQLREAYMRKCIRQAIKEGYQNIAVVCGAWHAPVLHQHMNFKASADNKLLRGLKKIKTQTTWVPWTYERLSISSGYGAGVVSPAYYHLLFEQRGDVVTHWMTKVARLLRAEDLDASSAHIIEAVRLARTLATMRSRAIAGLTEMREAAVAIFCEGDATRLRLIEQQLVIGDRMGQVPAAIPVIPLQQDIDKKIKSARLSKERKATGKVDKELDLRKASNLLASQLLHRMNLLSIPWGATKKVRKYGLAGTFHEHWQLKWQPEFALQIIEAGMWGNTVYDAAVHYVADQARQQQSLPELTQLVGLSLKADLKEAIEVLMQAVQDLSARTKDIQHLMGALSPLVDALRYGDIRQLDTQSLAQIIDQLIPRICIGLPAACSGVEEEAARILFGQLMDTHHAIHRLNVESHLQQWHQTLVRMIQMPKVQGILKGVGTHILFDKKIISIDQTVTYMRYALSRGQEATEAAYWIEGFLYGSGLLLIHNPPLWNIIDEWIDDLPFPIFKDLLPLLRRTFSEFSEPEKQKMMDLARRGPISEEERQEDQDLVQERAERVLPTIQLLLGINSDS